MSFRTIHARFLLCAIALASFSACGDDEAPGTCDLAAPSCGEGTVCIADAEGEGICADVCDPLAADACSDGQVCNRVLEDGFTCFDPVFIEGNIFDIATGSPIEGAQVMAADASGEVVTGVAVTDAAGNYRLGVPATRNRDGSLVISSFTLRVSAADYQTFPSGTRTAIPVATSDAVFDEDALEYTLGNATTSVGLSEHPTPGLPSISGNVGGDLPGGALVVAECGAPPCPFTYADSSGDYTIFNVPDGSYTVVAYKGALNVASAAAEVAGADVSGVDLAGATDELYTVTGSINPVEGAGATSVVLIPQSTFETVPVTLSDGVTVLDELVVRGEVAPGLRAPEPGIAPNVTGPYTIEGVPAGTYAILAGFENDSVCRDPDTNQAGTELVFITLPDDIVGGGTSLEVGTAFKVNPSLVLVSPGAEYPEPVVVGQPLTFEWEDDAGEESYELVVIDALGNQVWGTAVAKNASSIDYGGPALEVGMYYQWKLISIANLGNPIAVTEDLRGVFYGVDAL